MIFSKLIKALMSRRGLYFKPLGSWLAHNVKFAEVTVKVGIVKSLPCILISSIAMPFKLVFHVCGMHLLLKACINVLLRIADFGPTIMAGNFGRRISINLR